MVIHNEAPQLDFIWLLVGALSCTIAAILVTLLGFIVFPQFAEVFQVTGPDLPLPTRLVQRYFPVIWLAPMLVVFGWLFWPSRKSRGMVATLVGVLSLLIVAPCSLLAMYLPIPLVMMGT